MSDKSLDTHHQPEHTNHLCFMVARKGLLTKIDVPKVKELVSPANYVCLDCGRVAANTNNLCNPQPLK